MHLIQIGFTKCGYFAKMGTSNCALDYTEITEVLFSENQFSRKEIR